MVQGWGSLSGMGLGGCVGRLSQVVFCRCAGGRGNGDAWIGWVGAPRSRTCAPPRCLSFRTSKQGHKERGTEMSTHGLCATVLLQVVSRMCAFCRWPCTRMRRVKGSVGPASYCCTRPDPAPTNRCLYGTYVYALAVRAPAVQRPTNGYRQEGDR